MVPVEGFECPRGAGVSGHLPAISGARSEVQRESTAEATRQERPRGTHGGQGGASIVSRPFSIADAADDMDQAADAPPSPPSSVPSVSIARALELAAVAGQWGVVAQLGKELEARRLARAGNVVALPVPVSRRKS